MGDQSEPPKPQCETSLRADLEKQAADLEWCLQLPSEMEIAEQLLRCLTLTAPSGMKQADREEWLAVAMPEVEAIPSEIFYEACAHARRTCDHPAKIIPAIAGYKPESEWRTERHMRDRLASLRARIANLDAPKIEHAKQPAKPVLDDDTRRGIATGFGDLIRDLKSAARVTDAPQ